MERGRQSGPPDRGSCAAGRQHGHVEPRLQEHLLAGAEPIEKFEVGGAAAEEDVLAVVEGEAVPADRGREAPERRPALEQHDLGAAVRGRQRGGDPCQASPDDADPGPAHGCAPARLRAATAAFSQAGTETRRRVTAAGSRSIRSSRRR